MGGPRRQDISKDPDDPSSTHYPSPRSDGHLWGATPSAAEHASFPSSRGVFTETDLAVGTGPYRRYQTSCEGCPLTTAGWTQLPTAAVSARLGSHRSLGQCWWEGKWPSCCGRRETVWSFLNRLKIKLPSHPAISNALLDVFPKEIYLGPQRDSWPALHEAVPSHQHYSPWPGRGHRPKVQLRTDGRRKRGPCLQQHVTQLHGTCVDCESIPARGQIPRLLFRI